MLARGVSNFGRVILFILIGAFFGNGCSFSKKEITLLLIHDISSSYIATQLEALCREQGFILQKTTDLSYCIEDSLKRYNTVILDIPIDTLEHRQQMDLERYVSAGGGLLGINLHTNYIHKWPWMEAFLHQEADRQEVSDPFALLTSTKATNAVEGITTNYGTGRVCFIYTHHLSTAKKNLANAVSYTIDHEQALHYQHVTIPRVPSSKPFSDVVLVKDLSEPVDMEVLPQGDVIFIERSGIVKFFNAKSYETKQMAHFNVKKQDGFGLTSIALDPDFKKNHWVYFGYTPLSDPHHQYISRYFLAEDSLILSTEKVLMKTPASTSVLSLLEFDENRNILAGFSPSFSDDAGRFLSQDTSLNSDAQSSVIYGRQDQILKLPLDPDTTLQISWAKANNDSIVQMTDYYLPKTHPQYFGFSSHAPSSKWGGISIFQDSIPHTRSLYGKQYKFPYLTSGNYFVTGPIYHADPHSTSINKLPDYYSNKLFMADAPNHRLLVATLDRNKQLYVIEPFQDTLQLDNPVRLKFASDGSLYVLEHGPVGYVSHHHARLRRITYANTNRLPVAKIEANKRSGSLPLTINFSAQASFDYDPNDSLHFEWVFPDTVIYTNTNLRVQYIFNEPGVYHPVVKVYDQTGSFSEALITVVAGNSEPEISFDTEVNRSFYWKSSSMPYKIKITDEEDGLTDTTSSLASIRFYEHPREQWYYTAKALTLDPEGILVLEAPPKDSLKDYTLVVNYKDQGANGVASHNTESIFPIRSPQLYATDADGSKEVLMRVDQKAWFTQNEAYILFKDIDMREINHLKYRIKPLVDGYLELRLNAPNGPVVSTLRMSSRESWAEFTVRVGQIEGSYDLYFVFRQSEDSLEGSVPEILCMMEWIYFGKEKRGNFYRNPDANDML